MAGKALSPARATVLDDPVAKEHNDRKLLKRIIDFLIEHRLDRRPLALPHVPVQPGIHIEVVVHTHGPTAAGLRPNMPDRSGIAARRDPLTLSV